MNAIENGKGKTMANKIVMELKNAGLFEREYGALVFDTTSSNTGVLKGAATFLEAELNTKLLWLACRHHIYEFILGAVWTRIFGPTKSKNNLEFKEFQERWKDIDKCLPTATLSEFSDEQLNTFKNKTISLFQDVHCQEDSKLPRDDYKESCELALIMLSVKPHRWLKKDHWLSPGAFSNARWMASLLYAPKMLAFGQQMENWSEEYMNKIEKFVTFTSLLYVRYWIQSANGRDAPYLDLFFFSRNCFISGPICKMWLM